MSIGRRLFNMARSELNSLLDRALEAEGKVDQGQDPDADLYRRFSLDQLSDAELEAEIERRYRARQAAARAGATRPQGASSTAGRAGRRPEPPRPEAGPRSGGHRPPRRPDPQDELRRAYTALEVPFGADFATVRKSYRALMRKYHPDRHTGSADKQRAATELAQKLSAAYAVIEKHAKGV
jgi:DnaJ-domain-containing protein 1